VIRWIYNLLFNVGLVFAAPFYFLKLQRRGGWRENFGQRWGLYEGVLKQTLTNRRVVWLHAVSVGEVNLCLQLVDALQRRLPHHKLVVSTTTSTGMAELKRRLPGSVTRIYYPIDRRRQVQRALSAIHPRAMVFIESELWPNMIWGLQRRGIPYFLVGHVGDGNFHFGYLIDPDNAEERAKAETLNNQLVARALSMDGTCTGEHGIGLHKMEYLVSETGAGAVSMMRTIKKALDPKNIMNPGKIFLD